MFYKQPLQVIRQLAGDPLWDFAVDMAPCRDACTVCGHPELPLGWLFGPDDSEWGPSLALYRCRECSADWSFDWFGLIGCLNRTITPASYARLRRSSQFPTEFIYDRPLKLVWNDKRVLGWEILDVDGFCIYFMDHRTYMLELERLRLEQLQQGKTEPAAEDPVSLLIVDAQDHDRRVWKTRVKAMFTAAEKYLNGEPVSLTELMGELRPIEPAPGCPTRASHNPTGGITATEGSRCRVMTGEPCSGIPLWGCSAAQLAGGDLRDRQTGCACSPVSVPLIPWCELGTGLTTPLAVLAAAVLLGIILQDDHAPCLG